MTNKNEQPIASFGEIVVCGNSNRTHLDIDDKRSYLYIPLTPLECEVIGVEHVINPAIRIEVIK